MKPEQLLKILKENPENPRTISKEKFEKLKKKISSFPKMLELRPIVYNKKFIVLGGNMRLKALKELQAENKIKLKDVYFKKADQLTEAEQKDFIILDNQAFGNWDMDILANNWDTNDLLELGFNERELGGISIEKLNAMDEWNKNIADEFEIADNEPKLVITFKTERKREKFCNDLELEISHKQAGTWSVTI